MKKARFGAILRQALDTPIDAEKKRRTIYLVATKYQDPVRRKTDLFFMIRSTFGHTSVLFWILSAAIYIGVGLTAYGQKAVIIGAPLVAALGFTSWAKSFYYGMWELEKTCRFDLRRLLLLKLTITGTANTAIVLAASLAAKGEIGQLGCVVCTMAAFVCSCFAYFLFFEITGKVDIRFILSALVILCGSAAYLCGMKDAAVILGNLKLWLTVLVILSTALVLLLLKNIRKEELHNG